MLFKWHNITLYDNWTIDYLIHWQGSNGNELWLFQADDKDCGKGFYLMHNCNIYDLFLVPGNSNIFEPIKMVKWQLLEMEDKVKDFDVVIGHDGLLNSRNIVMEALFV